MLLHTMPLSSQFYRYESVFIIRSFKILLHVEAKHKPPFSRIARNKSQSNTTSVPVENWLRIAASQAKDFIVK